MEPLSSVPLTSLVPYGAFEDDVMVAYTLGPKENSPIESQNIESPNLGDNPVQTLLETLVPITEI